MTHQQQQRAWMPTGKATFLNPHPQALQLLGAVNFVSPQPLDKELYLSLLADRLQEMYQRQQWESPEELAQVLLQLKTANLLDVSLSQLPRWQEAGRILLLENPAVQERLYEVGLLTNLPKLLKEHNPQAAELIKGTTLSQWANPLTMLPVEADRQNLVSA